MKFVIIVVFRLPFKWREQVFLSGGVFLWVFKSQQEAPLISTLKGVSSWMGRVNLEKGGYVRSFPGWGCCNSPTPLRDTPLMKVLCAYSYNFVHFYLQPYLCKILLHYAKFLANNVASFTNIYTARQSTIFGVLLVLLQNLIGWLHT